MTDATVSKVKAGWWTKLEGDERDLRELAAHFGTPAVEAIEERDGFWLGSSGFAGLTDPETVQEPGRELLALGSGALRVEFGHFAPSVDWDRVWAS